MRSEIRTNRINKYKSELKQISQYNYDDHLIKKQVESREMYLLKRIAKMQKKIFSGLMDQVLARRSGDKFNL